MDFKKQNKRYWIQAGDYDKIVLLQRQKTNIKGNTSIQTFKLLVNVVINHQLELLEFDDI